MNKPHDFVCTLCLMLVFLLFVLQATLTHAEKNVDQVGSLQDWSNNGEVVSGNFLQFSFDIAKSSSVRILEIVENSHIVGRVFGISPEHVNNYKVVVYVKTDKWYIHPYERGGEGLSFASINPDGSWQIQAVKRRFLADSVAALLVNQSYKPPSVVRSLTEISAVAMYIGEGDGKL